MRVLALFALLASVAALAPVRQQVNRVAVKAPTVPAAMAAVTATLPLAAMAAEPAASIDVVALILPVGSLILLLTGVLTGIIGYTTIGDGPANPAKK